MKQLGFFLLGLGVALFFLEFLSINTQGVWWDILFILAGVFASLWIPKNEELFKLRLLWRIAIILVILCTFVFVWFLFNGILPEHNYSASITSFFFSLQAFIFPILYNRKRVV